VGMLGGAPSPPFYLLTYSLFMPTMHAWKTGVSDSPVSANYINFLVTSLPNPTINQIVKK